ncbi:hypothetical protein [Marinicellulosiphila megalodicopiae]|uniref:hypothetical protein n=1 Tax=Marinicellulosiphila megalodicopiae TaxID=2724896 RepID=UPI003BAE595F
MSKKPAKNSVSNANIRMSIEEQTAAFLNSGGSIQQISKGTSGQVNLIKPVKPVQPKKAD